ncbi:MAG: tyrosine-type recombinase/integrase [Patescibacteria group bacterium]
MADEKDLKTNHEKFIAFLKDDKKSSSTILAYGKDVYQLIEFAGEKKISQVGSITAELIEEFKSYLQEKNYTPKSVSRKLNSIKTFFRFLITQKIIDTDPATAVTHPKYEIKPPRILSKMEYRALRDACRNDHRMAAIIELLLQSGIRIGELARLELDDIKEKGIEINPFESHEKRTIPLNNAARKAIDRYFESRQKTKSRAIFVTKTGKPLLVRNIRSAIDRYFKIAGIKGAKVNDLRHTFIAYQLSSGTPVTVVQKLVGHKRLSTTEKYLEFVEKDSEEKIKLEEL